MDVKILSYNIHKGVGWNTYKSTIPQLRMEIDRLKPDIIFFQEILDWQFELIASDWLYSTYGENASLPKKHYGNAIVSNHPIIVSHNTDLSMHRFERRGMLHAIIKIANQESLHLLCVHLGLRAKDRHKQLQLITEYINGLPLKEPIILAGDFNDWREHATAHLTNALGLQEAFREITNTYARTFPAWAPILKLDRVYFRGFQTNEVNRLNNKPWRYLSDHIALLISLNRKP